MRDRIGSGSGARMYLVPGVEHVFMDNGVDNVVVNGVKLEEWISQGIAGDPNWANVSQP